VPDTQLFLHVLGAMLLFGATATVAVLALAARGREEQRPLARAAFFTLLALALPSWVLMFVFGTWTESELDITGEPGWIELGFRISDFGLIALLVSTGLAYLWTRRARPGWHVTAVGILTGLYLVALAVAWWAMSAKVPS
jgi:hypothetical protein